MKPESDELDRWLDARAAVYRAKNWRASHHEAMRAAAHQLHTVMTAINSELTGHLGSMAVRCAEAESLCLELWQVAKASPRFTQETITRCRRIQELRDEEL